MVLYKWYQIPDPIHNRMLFLLRHCHHLPPPSSYFLHPHPPPPGPNPPDLTKPPQHIPPCPPYQQPYNFPYPPQHHTYSPPPPHSQLNAPPLPQLDPWQLQQVSEIRSLCTLVLTQLDIITSNLMEMKKTVVAHSSQFKRLAASNKLTEKKKKAPVPTSKPAEKTHDSDIDNFGQSVVDLDETAEHSIVIPKPCKAFGAVQLQLRYGIELMNVFMNKKSFHETKQDVIIDSLFDENMNPKTHHEEWKTLFGADNVFDRMFGKVFTIIYETDVDELVDILLERNVKKIFEKIVFVFDPGGGTIAAEDVLEVWTTNDGNLHAEKAVVVESLKEAKMKQNALFMMQFLGIDGLLWRADLGDKVVFQVGESCYGPNQQWSLEASIDWLILIVGRTAESGGELEA